ncbi:MAG: hypothetical protein GW778_05120 [Alphaproteobacteria bacterium]|nr:hypothetical protein [Alphaproteobacteria bacterium]
MQAKLKRAFQAPAHPNMEIAFDLMTALEALGVHDEVIEDIIKDYELSQVNGTYDERAYARDILALYRAKDGDVATVFAPYL